MNILYLSDVSLDEIGGAQESMKIIMEELEEQFDFKIIIPKTKKKVGNSLEIRNFDSFTIRKNRFKNLRLILEFHNIIKNKNIDLIHVQMPSTMLLISFMRKFRLIDKKIKIIYTDRGVLDKYGRFTFLGIKMMNKYFERIIITTKNNQNLYRKILNIDDNRLVLIPNTAGREFEIFDIKYKNKCRKNLYYDDDKIIMFAGRYSEDKNWPLSLDIIESVKHNKKIKFIIAIGRDEKEEYLNYINNVKNIIPEDRFQIYIDVKKEEMSKLYYRSDIFILTSKKESFGRTAIEAMSRGNIVYGTRVDGLQEVIGFDDYLYNDIKELNEKLSKIIDDDNSLIKEKYKFLRRFQECFSLDINIKKHIELYRSLE